MLGTTTAMGLSVLGTLESFNLNVIIFILYHKWVGVRFKYTKCYISYTM